MAELSSSSVRTQITEIPIFHHIVIVRDRVQLRVWEKKERHIHLLVHNFLSFRVIGLRHHSNFPLYLFVCLPHHMKIGGITRNDNDKV